MNGDYWSEDGLVFYHNGEGWAIHPTGITVCLCQEDSTIKILKHEIDVNTVKKDDQRETLTRMLEIREENGDGEQQAGINTNTSLRASGTKQRNNQRIRLVSTSRNKLQNFKLPKAGC